MKKIALAALVSVGAAAPAYGASYDNLNAGIQYYNLRQWNDAIQQFDVALAPNDLAPTLQFIAHFDRAQSHRALSQYDKAIEDYSASLALRPGEVPVLIGRAFANSDAGKLDQAAADLDNAIAARPLLGSTYQVRASLYLKLGETEKAREDMRTMLKLSPNSHDIFFGIFNWATGHIDEAELNFSYEADKGIYRIYGWLWYALAEVRLGKTVPRRSLPDLDQKFWPVPIVAFFLGKTTQDSVLAVAGQGDPKQIKVQLCQANFYIGEWLLQHHDAAGARPLLSKAANDCPPDVIEWMSSKLEWASLP